MRVQRFLAFASSPYTLLTLTALFWSGNWVVGRAMRNDASPVALAFWRWAVAYALLLPFAWPHVRREWRQIWQARRVLVILGMLGTGTYNVLSYTGLQTTSATNAVMLNSVLPILIVAMSWALLGEKLAAMQGVGVAISLIGVLCILTRADLAMLLGLRFNTGDLWIFASMLVWALYTVALKWRPADLHPLSFLASLATVGLAMLSPYYIAEIATGGGVRLTMATALGLAYLGVFPALLAYIFWNRAVAEVGPNLAGIFMHLMPVFVPILAIAFLGESLHLYHVFGMALILAGVYMTTHFGRTLLPSGVKVDE
jgi:drug/metabolite transporter (DMT)-like permease